MCGVVWHGVCVWCRIEDNFGVISQVLTILFETETLVGLEFAT